MKRKMQILFSVVITGVLLTALVSTKSNNMDHSGFFQKEFDSPQDVTKACMNCHAEQTEDFMKTRHWNWEGEEFEMEGHGMVKVGKKNLINNFCIAVTSNYPRCTSCHPGYGWEDETFDFSKAENVDCLICHDQTGTYKKTPTGAGMPAPDVDLLKVAKNVGKPTADNCGQCHFNGGGGAAVKHGDLDPALLTGEEDVDVHMAGLGFDCVQCHTTEKHKISGASHGSMAQGVNHISCENCHEPEGLHKNKILNQHTSAIGCETCHIPSIGRNMATKTYWDWSTAGTKEKTEKDEEGRVIYAKKKGDFKWEKNVTPTYFWYDGSADYYMAGDQIDPNSVVQLNTINGDISDKDSKIYPFKKMTGKQPFDEVHKHIIIPKLFGPGGFWKTYDWAAASEKGMAKAGFEFSGEVGFVKTEMYWPQNHAVAPTDQALKCTDCHNNNRMDWEALGYPGDPMKKGGRERNGLLK